MCSALPVRAVTFRVNANATDAGAAVEAQQHMRRLPVDNEGKDKDKGKKDNIMAACQASSQS